MSDIIVLAAGERCIRIANSVYARAVRAGICFRLVNVRFIKPLDIGFLASMREKYVVTLEDNVLAGGFGESVARALAGSGKQVYSFGYPDAFIPHGASSDLMKKYGLSEEEIYARIEELYARG